MTLPEAISAAGMTPPRQIIEGRWMRFPGIGKNRSNRAGWCRLITPTLAIFGDWSSNLRATWRDDAHRDDEQSARLLAQAHERERAFCAAQRKARAEAASFATLLINQAKIEKHPYLERKGFPDLKALVFGDELVVPVRDSEHYGIVLSAQRIKPDGTKRFVTGGRAGGGIYRIGAIAGARRIWLCEGYATGLSIDAAAKRLPGPHVVIVCFSAGNLERVASSYPNAFICADHDASRTGEETAIRTGLEWIMPPMIGDFNDLHQQQGLHAVTEALRTML